MEKINNESHYADVMSQINSLMEKGSAQVTPKEFEKIRQLALAAQNYEQKKYIIEAPTTLIGMIEMRMYEMKLKHKDLAKKLKISNSKLSMIMNGKQKPDIDFLKAVYAELNVDAAFILEHA